MKPIENQLIEDLKQAMLQSPYFNGRELRLETDAGRVTLSGNVNSYFQKQMAQEALLKIDGVDKIENDLEVIWS